jgi:ATP/maltotriose-dependent transcriptional regulator MalT
MILPYIFSIISISFCLIFFFYFKWYIKKRTGVNELLAEYRTEVYRLNADINSTTDRNLQLIEDKIAKLKLILEDTEKRITDYKREMEKNRTGEALYTSLGRGIRAALKTPVEPPSVIQPPVQKPPPALSADKPKLSIVRQEEVPAQVQAAPEPPGKNQSKRHIRAQIETLVNQGVSPGEIASRLDISLAEIDLVMNLRRIK